MNGFAQNRDYYAGGLVALIGAGAILEGRAYGIGKLTAMGSGFFPVMLGCGLIAMGALMAMFRTPAPAATDTHHVGAPDWRGALAIAAAVGLFIGLAKTAGLLPAIFACVFVGALGTRRTTLREAALLAAGVTVFGILLFAYLLHVPFPILTGVL